MIIQRGVTSFFKPNKGESIPEFSFTDYRTVVFGIAQSLRFRVSLLTESSATPNFHSACLVGSRKSFQLLGHSNFPILACALPRTPSSCQLIFVDEPEVTDECHRLFPQIAVLRTNELNRTIQDSELANLDDVEREQVKYWKPKTVGELVFNWWD